MMMMEARKASGISDKSSLPVAKRVHRHGARSICGSRCSGKREERESSVDVTRKKCSMDDCCNLITN